MKKPKITFYGIWPDMKEYIRSKISGHRMNIYTEPLTADNLQKDTEILAAFVHSNIDKKIINGLPKLKMIATMSTGFNHIDLGSAKKKKIPVCNVPTYGENTVAEHAFALLLGLSRKIFPSVKRVKEGVYDFHGLRGTDLKGKTIGIIGTGHIGIHMIRMAQGFEMNVIAFDAFPNQELASKNNFKYVTLNKLLSLSDFISLHVPLFPTTLHMINKKNIKKIKKGSFIINTARGELIEPAALLWALEKNYIAGAGLDVLEDEEYVQHEEKMFDGDTTAVQIKTNLINNIIIDHPNTIVTPHNAFNSTEALQRILDVTVENIKSFTNGVIINDVTKLKKKK